MRSTLLTLAGITTAAAFIASNADPAYIKDYAAKGYSAESHIIDEKRITLLTRKNESGPNAHWYTMFINDKDKYEMRRSGSTPIIDLAEVDGKTYFLTNPDHQAKMAAVQADFNYYHGHIKEQTTFTK